MQHKMNERECTAPKGSTAQNGPHEIRTCKDKGGKPTERNQVGNSQDGPLDRISREKLGPEDQPATCQRKGKEATNAESHNGDYQAQRVGSLYERFHLAWGVLWVGRQTRKPKGNQLWKECRISVGVCLS